MSSLHSTDIFYCDDGDLFIDNNNDFGLTDSNLRSITQEIKNRLESGLGEFKNKKWGASIESFCGLPIDDPKVITAIKTRATAELKKFGLLDSSDFRVEIIKISKSSILIVVGLLTTQGLQILRHQFDLGDKKL